MRDRDRRAEPSAGPGASVGATVVSVGEAGSAGSLSPPPFGAPRSPASTTPAAAIEPALARASDPFGSAPGRSPLERSPGYVPPADPESASVRLGRREAPLLEGEFDGGAASLEELGRLVVAALNAADESGLHALRVTRAEFERYFWREFPQSRPITNITADDAWGLSDASSLAGASRAVGQLGGRRLRFIRVEHGPTQDFANFDLVRGIEIVAESEITREIHTIRLVPSAAVRNGRYKALLYRD
ncbi:MAG TPA: hypothetical protein VFT32_05310 [Candidatus Eisenbacteria bacterium]|nr:hypothetical protein [Candidatus Eisenbacteria bacterium]